MSRRLWFVGLVLLCGCVLDDDVLRQSELFACSSDADCPEAGFECRVEVGLCFQGTQDLSTFCQDEDEDGYGVGPERRGCANTAEDTNDADATTFPNAPDICDGKDNDGNGTTDIIPCTNTCPQGGVAPEGAIGFCENNVCVYKPANQRPAGCDRALTCSGSAGYEPVPDACML